jgi:hypothetical protein
MLLPLPKLLLLLLLLVLVIAAMMWVKVGEALYRGGCSTLLPLLLPPHTHQVCGATMWCTVYHR